MEENKLTGAPAVSSPGWCARNVDNLTITVKKLHGAFHIFVLHLKQRQ